MVNAMERWALETCLNGTYERTVWDTYDGAIANRERLLHNRVISLAKGKSKTVIVTGWTAIHRIGNRNGRIR